MLGTVAKFEKRKENSLFFLFVFLHKAMQHFILVIGSPFLEPIPKAAALKVHKVSK